PQWASVAGVGLYMWPAAHRGRSAASEKEQSVPVSTQVHQSEKEMIMQLKTVRLVGMLALVLLTAPLTVNAQSATKVHRLGWLSSGSPLYGSDLHIEAFQQGLHDLGYIEGQNLTIEYRYAEGNVERLPDLAAELVRLHVDIIFTGSSTPAARAAKQATSMIPIIMAGIGADPVESGLVASLARPEGNVTGVTASGTEV